jgi:hypothetical protein
LDSNPDYKSIKTIVYQYITMVFLLVVENIVEKYCPVIMQ